MAKTPTEQKDLFLERRGYLRCTFDFEEGEECLGCDKEQPEGARQYWVSTSYEIVEGDYYCRRCAYARTRRDYYDVRPMWRKRRPMHGAGWAYLHGMKNWEDIFYRGMLDDD